MTREEVKAQLAKNPLEWEAGQGEMVARLPNLTQWLEVKYSIDCGELAVEVSTPGYCFKDYIASSNDNTELKVKAESHRLDFICRLLGINEQ